MNQHKSTAEWQIDHTKLNIDVEKRGSGEEKRPWLTIITDFYTRRIVGFKLSSEPLTDAQMAQFLDETLEDESTKIDEDKEGN
jgi:transposase InsO family protein